MFCALNPVCGEPSEKKAIREAPAPFFGHLHGQFLQEDAPKKKHGAAKTTSRKFLIADPPISPFVKIIKNTMQNRHFGPSGGA